MTRSESGSVGLLKYFVIKTADSKTICSHICTTEIKISLKMK